MARRQVVATFTVRVPPELLEELERIKVATGRSLNALAVEALEQYVATQGKAETAA